MEQPFFFENGTTKLFGVTHSPDGTTADEGFVLVHPFGEEKLWSHRVFVNFAREAAAKGYPVLRFDMSGHGDSEGQTETCTVETYLADIECAQSRFHDTFPSVKNVGLVGLRLGASLACLSAARSGTISDLILWEPVLDGARYLQELLRINLGTQLAVHGSVKENREALVEKMKLGIATNVDGYLIARDFFDECASIDLAQIDIRTTTTASLVTQIAPNIKQKDRQELVDFANSLPGGTFLKVEEPPFWREIKPFSSRTKNLISATLDHVKRKDGS